MGQQLICRTCERAALSFRDDISECEYYLSYMCQHCQDAVFADTEGILSELGWNDEYEPTEDELIELTQNMVISVEAQRWLVALLYGKAFQLPPK